MRRWLSAACIAGGLGLPAQAQPDMPQRVVSVNLCTDQLALLLAAPGQVISVSDLARDSTASAMADQAKDVPSNDGQAEQVFLLNPDLVLAGAFTAPATVQMLRRLGIRVEVFAPDTDLQGIRDNLRRMGQVLGRAEQAQRIIADFDAGLGSPPAGPRPRAAIYAANGYSSGSASLAGQIVAQAGFDNIADDLGLGQGGHIPLEVLLMSRPDLLILGRRYPGHSRAEEPLDHPALRALMAQVPVVTMSDPDWVCGTPHVLRTIAALRQARP